MRFLIKKKHFYCSNIVFSLQLICRIRKQKFMEKYAILVVDMLNDFVTGALKCERGEAIVPALASFLSEARKHKVPVIFCNDAHLKDIDAEFKLWAPHAIKGTKGAEVIKELNLDENVDYVVPKRRYSGFFHTDLDLLLEELGITTVIVTGLHTHMCVRHTSADAFQLGYSVIINKEGTNSFTEEDYQSGLKYLKDTYGAKILTSEEIIKLF